MEEFEVRNNISVTLEINSDGSGNLKEFWSEDVIKCFETLEELPTLFRDVNLKLAEDGRCITPMEII